jgi:hypothetical protein
VDRVGGQMHPVAVHVQHARKDRNQDGTAWSVECEHHGDRRSGNRKRRKHIDRRLAPVCKQDRRQLMKDKKDGGERQKSAVTALRNPARHASMVGAVSSEIIREALRRSIQPECPLDA